MYSVEVKFHIGYRENGVSIFKDNIKINGIASIKLE